MRGRNGLLDPMRLRVTTSCGVEHPPCVYQIDAGDCLVDVSGSWSDFATRNGGPHVQPDRVLRTSIWNYIAGLENRLLYSEMLAYVRESRHKVRFAFRCDGPTTRRELRMDIAPCAQHACRFTTTTLLEIAQPYLALLDPAAEKTDECLSLCNWCMRIQTRTDAWYDLRDGLIRLGLLDQARGPRPVFTICPDCLGQLAEHLPLRI